MHLVAEPALRSDREGVADQQHADHQLGVARGAAGCGVVGRQRAADLTEIQHGVHLSKKVIGGNVALEIEPVKQVSGFVLPSHHPRRLRRGRRKTESANRPLRNGVYQHHF
jgi:hypothetical protein